MADGAVFEARGEHVVIASGGICGGDLSRVRAHWYGPWGAPPEVMVNGAHRFGDGLLHDQVAQLGGRLTYLDLHWHYPAGVHHPARRKPNDGLSLVPPRSALWMNALGERIGPVPLVAYSDTRWLVESVLRQPGKYSWQVLNWKIAAKELAVSGAEYMTDFVEKRKLSMARHLLFGNDELVERLIRECPDDFVVADTVPELVGKMNEKNLFGLRVDEGRFRADIEAYDAMIDRGPAYFSDDQLRRIMNARSYRGDRIRTCKFQKILDPKARPLIAIREFILARKSLGGIQTDLQCRVLRAESGEPIPGLYAVGEAAGFGGGGMHGKGSLEGTFLGGCILSGRQAGRSIAK
jgi:predicted oxidoreductase